MQRGHSEKAEKAVSDLIDSWSSLIAALMKLTYQKPDFSFKKGIGDQGALNLCLGEHFIESQITNIDVYADNNNTLTITNINKAEIPDNPKRVIITVEHMKLEYVPADETNHEKISITGQKYNFYSSDEMEATIAGLEKAKAALNLAYAAKAMGWTEVDFGHTNDPIDRLFLTIACDHVGLSYHGETPKNTIVAGVTILNQPVFESALVVSAKKGWENLPEEKKKKANPVIMAVNEAFKGFIASYPSPISMLAPQPTAPHP